MFFEFCPTYKTSSSFPSHVEFMMMIFVEAIIKPNSVANLAVWYSFSMAIFYFLCLLHALPFLYHTGRMHRAKRSCKKIICHVSSLQKSH